jgi:hypothetical protein
MTANRVVASRAASLLAAGAVVIAQTHSPAFPRPGAKPVTPNLVGVEGPDAEHPPSAADVMNAWDVTYTRGQATGLRERQFDQLVVTIDEGAVKVTRPDKTWTIERRKMGSVQFESKGTVLAEEGASDPPSRAIVVQFKSYAAVPKLPPAALRDAAAKGIAPQFPRRGVVKLFENEQMTVWDDSYPLNQLREMHAHFRTTIGIFIQGGEGRQTPVNHPYYVGEVNFSPPRLRTHQDFAVKGPPRGIFVEFK